MSTRGAPTAVGLLDRPFARGQRDLSLTVGITEHPTREGKVYRAVVLDGYSRWTVGWPIDASQSAAVETRALGMAINTRRRVAGAILIHPDDGVHPLSTHSGVVTPHGLNSCTLRERRHRVVRLRMQVELIGRRRWKNCFCD